jgi:uncharacterized protein YycO
MESQTRTDPIERETLMKFLSMVEPISWLIGKIHAPFSNRLIKGKDFYAIQGLIQPGDIIVTRIRWHLTNLFIPKFWKHASIVSPRKTIIEAIGEGVVETDLFDFISTKDYVCVLRLVDKTSAHLQASMNALNTVGLKYDYEFEDNDNEYYCSELVYWAFQRAGTLLCAPKSKVFPSDFFHAVDRLQNIYMSDSCTK